MKNMTIDLSKISEIIYWKTDEMRFEMIIANLLHNSIKFGKRNGKIQIELKTLNDLL